MSKVAKYEISLKCFLKNKKGETLILKTPAYYSFNGMYDFPGGRIDEDEFETDYIDILKREIEEETGIKDVKIDKKVVAIGRHKVLAEQRKNHTEDNFLFYVFFEGILDCDDCPIMSREHLDFKWVILDDIVLEDYFCSAYLEGARMYLNK